MRTYLTTNVEQVNSYKGSFNYSLSKNITNLTNNLSKKTNNHKE